MEIKVTASHIEQALAKGTRNIAHECPIALALSEAFAEPCWVGVQYWGKQSTFYNRPNNLPKEAKVFRERFDEGDLERAKPFSFEID